MKWSLQHTSKSLGVDGRCRQSDDENKENERGSGVSLGHRDGWMVARFVCYCFACCRVKNEAAKQRMNLPNLATFSRTIVFGSHNWFAARLPVWHVWQCVAKCSFRFRGCSKTVTHSSCFVLTHEGSDENEMSVRPRSINRYAHFCCSSTTPSPPTTER